MRAPRIRAAYAWPLSLTRFSAFVAVLATTGLVVMSLQAAPSPPRLASPSGDGSRDSSIQARGTTQLFD